MKHTPEPWHYDSCDDKAHPTVKAGEYFITDCCSCAMPLGIEEEPMIANAKRIVACVNALAGIEDPAAFVEQAKAALAPFRSGK